MRHTGLHWTSALAIGIGILFLILPMAPLSDSSGAGVRPSADPPGAITATVTWNGVDVSSASSNSAALSTNFGSTIDVHYTWSSKGGLGASAPPLYNISTARLQMFYLGFALDTRDVVDSNPLAASNGSFDMSWDPGFLRYVVEGAFGLTASLIAPNGSTMWSENFFIHANAPFSVLALLPILLLVIAAYEVYLLLVSGRQNLAGPTAASVGTPPKNPPAPPTSAPAPGSTPGPSAQSAPSGTAEPTPPSGGSP